MDPVWIALVGTLFGSAGLKAVEHFLSRDRVKVDDAAKIRDELRLEITSQREEIKALEADALKWRDEYYNLRDKYVALQTELTLALRTLQAETNQAIATAEQIRNEPPEIE